MKLIINSPSSLALVLGEIKEQSHKHKYLRININSGRDRSGDQNALFHQWITILTQKGGEFTFDGYRNMCRLHFFVPIARANHPDFKAVYDDCLLGLEYDQKLKVMGVITGISSILTTKEFSQALEDMQKHFATLTTDPIFLEFTEDE